MYINSLDNASWVAGARPDDYTPVVLTLRQNSCYTCLCDCSAFQRIPSGFDAIQTQCNRDVYEDEDDEGTGKGAYVAAGGHWTCVMAGANCCLAPWTQVSKLVTHQLVVFECPIADVKTKDHVSVRVDCLVTFKIINGRHFIYKLGPDKLDKYMRASMDECIRTMAIGVDCREFYELQGGDKETEDLRAEMNVHLKELGVEVKTFTVKQVFLPQDLAMVLQAKTGFLSQTAHLEAAQQITMQGMENQEEIIKMTEIGKIEQLGVIEQGDNFRSKIEIEITEVNARNKKELSLTKAKYEEEVSNLVNDAELEVQDLNNQRDTVARESESRTAKECNEIKADAYMYARGQQLELVMKQAEMKAEAMQAKSKAEANAAEVIKNRRAHEQAKERLKVYAALSSNKDMRIASSAEVQAAPNMKFSEDSFDKVVHTAVQGLTKYMQK